MMLKVFAVAVVLFRQIDLFGGGEPATVLVVDEQSMDAAETGLAHVEERLQSRDASGLLAVSFQGGNHTGEKRPRKFGGVVPVLHQ